MRVVDASVLVEALVGSGVRSTVARTVLRDDCATPELADVEVVSALRGMTAGGHLDDDASRWALRDLRHLRLWRYGHLALVDRMWQLRHNATPYDASYIALAEALAVPLVTADAKFLTIPGTHCEVELLSAA